MSREYKLNYTASEINEKLSKVDAPVSWYELKDRPFGETVETLVDNVVVECTAMQGIACGTIENVGFAIENDVTYQIIFDGIEYTCVGYSMDTGSPVVGNGHIFVSGREDTGEPFILAKMNGGLMVCVETVGTHTISVATGAIKTIDPKFLPVDIGGGDTEDEDIITLMKELDILMIVADDDDSILTDEDGNIIIW